MIWPADIAVPPRAVLGPRFAPEGTEEGAICGRAYEGVRYCQGRLELRPAYDLGGCTCWRSAPCSSCMSRVPECQVCGHREPEPSW